MSLLAMLRFLYVTVGNVMVSDILILVVYSIDNQPFCVTKGENIIWQNFWQESG
jgi:hypothetical protein